MGRLAIPQHSGNPAPGVIFEQRGGCAEAWFRATLNPDLTVTLETAQTTRTVTVGQLGVEVLQTWAWRCLHGEAGLIPGPVGLRMARNCATRALGAALGG